MRPGQVQSRDPGQDAGQQRALQGLGDGVLAGEGVRVGQAHRQATAEFLDHLDVGLGEPATPSAAAQDDDTGRAMGAQQRRGDRAARTHEPHDAGHAAWVALTAVAKRSRGYGGAVP